MSRSALSACLPVVYNALCAALFNSTRLVEMADACLEGMESCPDDWGLPFLMGCVLRAMGKGAECNGLWVKALGCLEGAEGASLFPRRDGVLTILVEFAKEADRERDCSAKFMIWRFLSKAYPELDAAVLAKYQAAKEMCAEMMRNPVALYMSLLGNLGYA